MRILFMIALLVLGSPIAQAHSWYENNCCSEKDCQHAETGDVEFRVKGWFVEALNELVPFGDDRIRPSQDQNLHLCLGPKKVRCIYVPEPGI